jgi:hypothetical protein
VDTTTIGNETEVMMLGRSVLIATVLLMLLPTVAPAGTGTNGTQQLSVDVGIKPAKTDSRVALNYSQSLTNKDGSRVTENVRRVQIKLAKGFRFDVNAVAQCMESTLEDPHQGPSACPPGSIVGKGTATVDARPLLPDLIQADVVAFNGLLDVDVNGQPQSPVAAILVAAHATNPDVTSLLPVEIHGSSLVLNLTPNDPANPSPYTIQDISLDIRRAGSKKKPYVRSPKSCPKGGWVFSQVDTFDTGAASITAKDKVACS